VNDGGAEPGADLVARRADRIAWPAGAEEKRATDVSREVQPERREPRRRREPDGRVFALHPRRLLHRDQRHRARAFLVRHGLRVAGVVARVVPRRLLFRCASPLGRFLWAVTRHRDRSLENLAIAFPERSDEDREAIAADSMIHLARNLLECLYMLARGAGSLLADVKVEGWDHVERARRSGRPILILTGHCGNWELLAGVICARGLPLVAVARALQSPVLQEALLRLRRSLGVESAIRGRPMAVRTLRRVLGGEAALGVLIDQETRVEGVWVPFFGRPAYTPVGPAEFALRHRFAVVPAFTERGSDGSHLARFHPSLDLPGDPVRATEIMTREVERQVRRVPGQWVWIHRRWRRRGAHAPAPSA
jgi:KDO2-lipid IV(A) lauroyltransferase